MIIPFNLNTWLTSCEVNFFLSLDKEKVHWEIGQVLLEKSKLAEQAYLRTHNKKGLPDKIAAHARKVMSENLQYTTVAFVDSLKTMDPKDLLI